MKRLLSPHSGTACVESYIRDCFEVIRICRVFLSPCGINRIILPADYFFNGAFHLSFRIVVRLSAVFLASLETLLVTMRSILPARASSIIAAHERYRPRFSGSQCKAVPLSAGPRAQSADSPGLLFFLQKTVTAVNGNEISPWDKQQFIQK